MILTVLIDYSVALVKCKLNSHEIIHSFLTQAEGQKRLTTNNNSSKVSDTQTQQSWNIKNQVVWFQFIKLSATGCQHVLRAMQEFPIVPYGFGSLMRVMHFDDDQCYLRIWKALLFRFQTTFFQVRGSS